MRQWLDRYWILNYKSDIPTFITTETCMVETRNYSVEVTGDCSEEETRINGESCTFTCADGYIEINPLIVTCNNIGGSTNGTWSSSTFFICVRKYINNFMNLATKL